MNGTYLLDTVAVISLVNLEKGIVDILEEQAAFFIAVITVGELYYGAYKSARAEENRARVSQLIQRYNIIGCDVETARLYGQTADQLRRKGRPIPTNDLWIAAVALQRKLTVITRDAHFDEIDGLSTRTW